MIALALVLVLQTVYNDRLSSCCVGMFLRLTSLRLMTLVSDPVPSYPFLPEVATSLLGHLQS